MKLVERVCAVIIWLFFLFLFTLFCSAAPLEQKYGPGNKTSEYLVFSYHTVPDTVLTESASDCEAHQCTHFDV